LPDHLAIVIDRVRATIIDPTGQVAEVLHSARAGPKKSAAAVSGRKGFADNLAVVVDPVAEAGSSTR
jgi:hypothetical protein